MSEKRSSIKTEVLTPNNSVVTLENVNYIYIRNLGANDANLRTGSGSGDFIFLPTGGEGIPVYVPEGYPLREVWKAEFPFGTSSIHIIYSYTNDPKTLT